MRRAGYLEIAMTDDDFPAFQAALRAAAEVTGHALSEEQIMLYWDLLSDKNIDDVKAAVRAHLRDPDRGRFMPRPADIIGAMPELEWWQKPTPPHPDLVSGHRNRRAIEDGTAEPAMDRRRGQQRFADLVSHLRRAPAPRRPQSGITREENREAIRRAREDLDARRDGNEAKHAT